MKKKTDFALAVFITLPILASAASFLFKTNVMDSVTLFLIIPSIILSFLQRRSIAKSVIFSILSVPVLLIIDYISHSMGQWIVPETVFPFRLFGLVPIEDSIWVFFMCYEVIMFYEYFFDSQKPGDYFSRKFIPLLMVAFVVPTLWFVLGFRYPMIFQIKYFYAIWGIILLVVPLFLFLINYPALVGKFIATGAYFFYLTFSYEVTALAKGWWYFPQASEFIGWVSIGKLFFPLEEFVFWLMLFAMGFLAWYEYFDDDRK